MVKKKDMKTFLIKCSFVNCTNTSMKSSMSHLVFVRPFTTLSIKINFETEVFSKIIEDL